MRHGRRRRRRCNDLRHNRPRRFDLDHPFDDPLDGHLDNLLDNLLHGHLDPLHDDPLDDLLNRNRHFDAHFLLDDPLDDLLDRHLDPLLDDLLDGHLDALLHDLLDLDRHFDALLDNFLDNSLHGHLDALLHDALDDLLDLDGHFDADGVRISVDRQQVTAVDEGALGDRAVRREAVDDLAVERTVVLAGLGLDDPVHLEFREARREDPAAAVARDEAVRLDAALARPNDERRHIRRTVDLSVGPLDVPRLALVHRHQPSLTFRRSPLSVSAAWRAGPSPSLRET